MEVKFTDYVEHGWKICRIMHGQKGPRSKGWNDRENAITKPEIAMHLQSAGLCHAYSGTAALDIDRFDEASAWLKERGIDVDALMNADGAVQILSGRSNRGKLLYALDTPLPSKSFANGAFELRCGTTTGKTAQDVLPPSRHPSGTTYEWKGNWRNLPPLPAALRSLWETEIRVPETVSAASQPTTEFSALTDLLSRKDPNCGYHEWIKIGMAIHHETGGSEKGFMLWELWSAPRWNNPDKTARPLEERRIHWDSFGQSNTPVTAASLQKTDVAAVDEFKDLTAVADFTSGGSDESSKPKPIGFTFLPLGELFLRPKPTWIIPDILPHAGVGAIYGQPGGGKSFLGVETALDVALGQPFRGVPVKQGAVLYTAAEDDPGIQARFEAGLAIRGAVGAPIGALPAAPNLTDKEQAKAFHASIVAQGRPLLVFIDTLARVTPGADENSGKDMGQIIAFCDGVNKATGALVLLIHHEGKTEGKGARGWSGLHGAFEVEWQVADEGNKRVMRVTKMKNAESGKTYDFRLAPVGTSCVVEWI